MNANAVGLQCVHGSNLQDAALMLEQSTTLHTKQLREIFSQAGKLYGSEMEK